MNFTYLTKLSSRFLNVLGPVSEVGSYCDNRILSSGSGAQRPRQGFHKGFARALHHGIFDASKRLTAIVGDHAVRK